jgi:outer membrane protein OmpA-like peptidoglycan-associated protein
VPVAGFSYTNVYQANGGNGEMPMQTGFGVEGVLEQNTFTKENATFTGWNSSANGSGRDFAQGASFSVASQVITTYFAQWSTVRIESQRLYFSPDSTALSPRSVALLNRYIDSRRMLPKVSLILNGHSDSMPGSKSTKLSSRRAQVVASYILQRLPAARISTRGWGASKNLGRPLDQFSQRVNRSVELNDLF